MTLQRGQAVLDSMVVLAASLSIIVIIAPGDRAAFGLAFDARQKFLANQAAASLSGALSLVHSAGTGTTVKGEFMMPSNARLEPAGPGGGGSLVLSYEDSKKARKAVRVASARGILISGSCGGKCVFEAVAGDDGVELRLNSFGG